MRKAILALAVVFAVAAVASAVPTGPGGTMYFNWSDTTTDAKHLEFWYVNINSDWKPCDDNGVDLTTLGNYCVDMGDVNDYAATTTYGRSTYTPWYHPTSGKLDMNGSYHDGRILVAARYDNTEDLASPGGTAEGYDLLAVSADINTDGNAEVAILNGGFNAESGNVTTRSKQFTLTTGTGFTQGNFDQGIVLGGYSGATRSVWTDSDNASTHFATADTSMPKLSGTGHTHAAVGYGACGANTYIDDGATAVTGVVIAYNRSDSEWRYTYKTATGYTQIQRRNSDAAVEGDFHIFDSTNGAASRFLIGDTDADGIPDIYYTGKTWNGTSWSPGKFIHGQDANGDGDIHDAGETWECGAPGYGYLTADYALIECPDDPDDDDDDPEWVIAKFDNYMGRCHLRVYGLDEFGDWDNTYEDVWYGTSETNTDPSLWDLSSKTYYARMNFTPLGEAVPEPATMMLVGTGLLGLVGIIRRRRLS